MSLQYRQLTLASHGSEFNTSDLLLPVMSSAGEGRAQGLELFLKKRLNDCLCGQIAYSLSRTEQAALDGSENISRTALDANRRQPLAAWAGIWPYQDPVLRIVSQDQLDAIRQVARTASGCT